MAKSRNNESHDQGEIINPTFKLVFLSVLGITIFSAGACLYLASLANHHQQLIETFSTTWKIGFGVIVGLLSAKGADVLHHTKNHRKE